MVENILAAISRAGIFLVCAQTLVHCRPKPVYEKYMKLLVGLMVLVLVLEPVFRRFGEPWEGGFNDMDSFLTQEFPAQEKTNEKEALEEEIGNSEIVIDTIEVEVQAWQ